MSLFNYNAKEIHCKVIYYGIKGAGKTTNIKWISQNTSSQKTTPFSIPIEDTAPSVYFDFLPLEIGTIRGLKTRFHLYSIPGGGIFENSEKMLLKGLDGIVFVADSQKEKMHDNREALKTLKDRLSEEGLQLEKIPMVMQYNKKDLSQGHSINQLRTELNYYNHPDFSACAVKGDQVFETLKTLLKMILTVIKGGRLQ